MIRELRGQAEAFTGAGEWLAHAMQASWTLAASMLEFDGLADVMGERHRIISNDWLAAHMQSLIGTLLARAADMLDRLDLTPAALRADLAGSRVAPQRLYATAEVISRAADLCCESAELVHDNERRWRVTPGAHRATGAGDGRARGHRGVVGWGCTGLSGRESG